MHPGRGGDRSRRGRGRGKESTGKEENEENEDDKKKNARDEGSVAQSCISFLFGMKTKESTPLPILVS